MSCISERLYFYEYALAWTYPSLSGVKIVVTNPKEGGIPSAQYDFAHSLIRKELGVFDKSEGHNYSKVIIETRPDSLYKYKRTIVSNDGSQIDTHYSIVLSEDISSFISNSGKMRFGEDKVCPLDCGKTHRAEIYLVLGDNFPPKGFEELAKFNKYCSNITLHLVLRESVAKHLIERGWKK